MEEHIQNNRNFSHGWILLFAIISFLLSIFLSYYTTENLIIPYSGDEHWIAISSPELKTFNIQWARLIIFDTAGTIAIFVYGCFLMFLIAKRSRLFPSSMVTFFMMRILFISLTLYFQTVIKGPETPELSEIFLKATSSLSIIALWVPYVLLSETVRETFSK